MVYGGVDTEPNRGRALQSSRPAQVRLDCDSPRRHDQRSDTRRYVISLAGSNRIGALAAVSQAVAELGGNICEIRQTVVDKFFAILLSADFPDEREVVLHAIGPA